MRRRLNRKLTQDECESDCREKVEVNYLRSNRENGNKFQEITRKVKKGGKYKIKKIGKDTTRRVEILSRAGKATRKY